MYRITEREMTFDDFLKLKKVKPFKTNRTDAKSINFGALFGCSGPSLGSQMKAAGFNEDKVTTAMYNFGLENAVNAKVLSEQQKGRKPDVLATKYAIVGTKIRELFFNIYPCLLDRTLREQEFAKKHGYVRTWTGPVRHLAELRWMKKNPNGEVAGTDALLYKKEFSHLCNDATNSPIQTAEVYQAMPDMTVFMEVFIKLGLRSRLFNTVHDSGEFYIYKPERDLVYALFTRVAAENRQPYFNIPMHIDVEESDPDKGEVFREGREVNIEEFDLKDEVDKWNEKFSDHQINYDDIENIIHKYIPIYGVLDTRKYIGHGYKPHKVENSQEREII